MSDDRLRRCVENSEYWFEKGYEYEKKEEAKKVAELKKKVKLSFPKVVSDDMLEIIKEELK